MEKSRMPLMITAVYVLLVGVSTLSPSLTRSVFGYDVKDAGVLLVLSGTALGFGAVLWAVAGNVQKYGGLASSVIVALAIGGLFLLWGWGKGLFTARNVLVPLIINVALSGWIWSARPKS
jgi:hypothetical protein